MPWMPDKMPSLPNGLSTATSDSVGTRIPELKSQADIKAAEKRILSSAENLNEIISLVGLVNSAKINMATEAASSLTKIFMRFRKHGKLTVAAGVSQDSPQAQIVHWLNGRYGDFVHALIGLLGSEKPNLQLVSLTLSLRLVKDETAHKTGEKIKFSNRNYSQLVDAFLQSEFVDEAVRNEFCDKYLNQYYDLQFYFLQNAGKLLQESSLPSIHRNIHPVLLNLTPLLPSDDTIPRMFTPLPPTASILLPSSYKVAFQSAWLAHLRHPVDNAQLKQLLMIVHKRIIPFMNKPQLLMDWLTDSYNSGGSVSLLALNGLWELMQKHNLDYPEFYRKLYALFTPSLFHSRYLARFLRLSDLFLSSIYLPAALVASFIKRLSRLSLSAPPQGIVAIIPMVYNLLKRHPSCMQIIHRPDALPGTPDSFNPDEPDPLRTGALESSLWELASLTNHYNSNVSSLAKILSEPFTKPNYNMEDFLDHSYGTMLDADLARKQRNAPVINHEKPPARIGEGKDENSVLSRLWEF